MQFFKIYTKNGYIIKVSGTENELDLIELDRNHPAITQKFLNSDKTFIDQLNEIKNSSKNKKINLIVGPEGDFSDSEKKIINEKNFIKVNLGRTILRTETAIVSLISIINELLINND